MKWSTERPTRPGMYWCQQYNRVRIVSVWERRDDLALLTNEDGGAYLADPELYDTAKWMGPIIPPGPDNPITLTPDEARQIEGALRGDESEILCPRSAALATLRAKMEVK